MSWFFELGVRSRLPDNIIKVIYKAGDETLLLMARFCVVTNLGQQTSKEKAACREASVP